MGVSPKRLDHRMYLFLDLETPGLHPWMGILETAWTLVHDDLSPLMTDICSVTHSMIGSIPVSEWNDFVVEMHTESGLLADLKMPDNHHQPGHFGVQARILEDISKAQGTAPGPVILAGQTPHGVDRPFIRHWMKMLDAELSYRHFDIRTLIEFFGPLGIDHGVPNSEMTHRAADDVAWSLKVARAYRDHMGYLNNLDELEGMRRK